MSPSSTISAILSASGLARRCASDAIKHWDAETPFNAGVILDAHPELRGHRSVLLDLAYEEYRQRIVAGDDLDPISFAEQFPSLKRSLLCYISVLRYIENNIELLGAAIEEWPGIGELFLNFKLIEELGRGSFSRVFLAFDTMLGDRVVVVKICRRGPEEAALLGQLNHSNIVPVLSARTDSETGLTAICMPFLTRATLLHLLDFVWSDDKPPDRAAVILEMVSQLNGQNRSENSPSLTQAVYTHTSYVDAIVGIGIQLVEALEFSHQQGIYHCDIKPSNVLMASDGSALLFDFNLSFQAARDNCNLGGTIPYMSPEQLKNLTNETETVENLDARTDLFALGVTLYELLTGKLPFGSISPELSGKHVTQHLLERQQEGPRPIHELNPNVDTRVAKLLESCLAFDPDRRPSSTREFADSLRSHFTKPLRFKRWTKSHKSAMLVASAFVLAGLGEVTHTVVTREPYAIRQLNQGWEAYRQQRTDDAVTFFNRTLNSDPENVNALFGRARAYLQVGQIQRAYDGFQATAQHVDNGRLTACIAHCVCLLHKDYRKSFSLYEQARSQGFESAGMLNNMGYCCHQIAEFEKAISYCEQALEKDDKLQAAYDNLALVEIQVAAMEKRVPDLTYIESAITLGPPNARLYSILAKSYAIIARYTPKGTPERAKIVDRLFDVFASAIQYGASQQSLQFVSTYISEIESDHRYQSLLRSATSAEISDSDLPIVDPLLGLKEPINLEDGDEVITSER